MSPVFVWLAAVGLAVWVVLAQGSLVQLEQSSEQFQLVTLTLNSFKKCPGHLDVPCTIDNITLYMDPENEHILFVDGVLNMEETVTDGAKVIFDMRRCYNEREESCEKYATQDLQDLCSHMYRKGMIWSDFITHIEGFPQTCPVPAGSYRITEGPIDLSNFKNQTEFLGHWQIEVSTSNDIKRYGCMLVDLTLALRNRRH